MTQVLSPESCTLSPLEGRKELGRGCARTRADDQQFELDLEYVTAWF